jgi:GntR family galactonate operon transcriptional repressor
MTLQEPNWLVLGEGAGVRMNLHGQIVDALGRKIIGGIWRPGERLPNEAELCSEMGVSRPIVREAMKSLAAKGLVETRTRAGTRVKASAFWNLLDIDVLRWRYLTLPRADFFRDLFGIRRVIEPAAAELAARVASESDVRTIEAACDAMEVADPNDDAAIIADLAFHRSILDACRNDLLSRIGTLIGVGLLTSFRLSTRSYPVSLPKHRPVLDAIRARDPASARARMSALLEETHEFIDGDLEHHGYGRDD